MGNITNPEAFQYEAAAILAAAYTHFPMRIHWDYDADNEMYPTETGQSREEIQANTIRWLDEHGYIGLEGFVGRQWRGIGLTERGLRILNSVPDVLSGKEPLGKRLVAAVKTGSWDIIKQVVPAMIQKAVTG